MKGKIKAAYVEKVITAKGRTGIQHSSQHNWTILIKQ